MSLESKVKELLDIFFETREDLFLVSLKVSSENVINVVIDGDESVTIQDCLDCSRAVENNLDREEQDFELSVLSAGLSSPLTLLRQYKKNVGRSLNVLLGNDEKIEGEIIEVTDEGVVLKWEERQPKKIGKGKETVVLERKIEYADIKKALIVIKF